jgi:hypothetical protein
VWVDKKKLGGGKCVLKIKVRNYNDLSHQFWMIVVYT